jgi:hypothetical protein
MPLVSKTPGPTGIPSRPGGSSWAMRVAVETATPIAPTGPLTRSKRQMLLPELVDRPVEVPPPAGDLHVRLVDEPAVPDRVTARPSGLDQQRGEPPHPPVNGDVVDLNVPLGEQLLHIAEGQAEAQVPPHPQHDHLRREPEPGEPRRGADARPLRRSILMPPVSGRSHPPRCNRASASTQPRSPAPPARPCGCVVRAELPCSSATASYRSPAPCASATHDSGTRPGGHRVTPSTREGWIATATALTPDRPQRE